MRADEVTPGMHVTIPGLTHRHHLVEDVRPAPDPNDEDAVEITVWANDRMVALTLDADTPVEALS